MTPVDNISNVSDLSDLGYLYGEHKSSDMNDTTQYNNDDNTGDIAEENDIDIDNNNIIFLLGNTNLSEGMDLIKDNLIFSDNSLIDNSITEV